MASLRGICLYLRRVSHTLATNAELADEVMRGVNADLSRFHKSGLLGDMVISGPMVLARLYSAGTRTDSGQIVQAVLTLPGGIGAMFWDSEDWFRLDDDPEWGAKVLRGIVPFEKCEPAIKALIAQHSAEMVVKLMGTFTL